MQFDYSVVVDRTQLRYLSLCSSGGLAITRVVEQGVSAQRKDTQCVILDSALGVGFIQTPDRIQSRHWNASTRHRSVSVGAIIMPSYSPCRKPAINPCA